MAVAGESIIPPAGPEKRSKLYLNRRAKTALVAFTLLSIVVAGAFYLRKKAPPEAARLLPESDAIVYFNVAPLRRVTSFDQRPVRHDPDYQRFIDATGIQFERDLNEAAFALHRMSNPLGPNGAVAYSSIFVGHFDRRRLAGYLEGVAQSKERYAGYDIYNIAVDGRIDRVALLKHDMVAVSNTPTAEQIHSILDRQVTALMPLTGNTLLRQRYAEIPVFSLAWGLGKLAVGLEDGLNVFGFKVPLSADATFIASLRWTGALQFKVEEIAPNGTAAAVSADALSGLLNIAKTAENVLPDSLTDPNTKALLNSIQIEHHSDRATVTAKVPLELVRKLAVTPESQPAP